MRRVKLLKNWKQHKAGDIVIVTPNEAHGLIDKGNAKITKDMTSNDFKTKRIKSGRSIKLRTNDIS
jgi:quercetin dioxygenase-like cupin family protein